MSEVTVPHLIYTFHYLFFGTCFNSEEEQEMFLLNAQTSSGTHSTMYPVGTGLSPEG